jgi:uncharacterized cupredoxin-like copper-binding protein
MRLSPRSIGLHWLVPALAAVSFVAACQYITPAQPTPTAVPPRVIDIDATDFAYAAPDTLPSGLVTLRLANHGQEPHHGQLLRLNDGVSLEVFVDALNSGDLDAAAPLVAAEGGPGALDPQRTTEVTLDLRPGTYVLVCFIPGADGVPHLAKGMLKPLHVTPSATAAAPPQTDGTITLKDFSFDMPDSVVARRTVWKVTNQGPQAHEVAIAKLGPATSIDEVRAFFDGADGPPPFELVGGINGLDAGKSGFMTLDLEPGRYAAICMIPDPASQQPHLHLGMARLFNVSG